MHRRGREVRAAEQGAMALAAFLVLFSVAVGGFLHSAGILASLIEVVLVLALIACMAWVGIRMGMPASRRRRSPASVFQQPTRSPSPTEKGALANLVWPDEKGTTLRPLPLVEALISQVDFSPPTPVASKHWTETEILQAIHNLDWYQFEKFNVDLFKSEGWDAIHFRGQYGDGGKDIVAKKDGQTLFVQCKAWTKPIQENVVRELSGSLSIARVASGAIHAAGKFSDSARALAATVGIHLHDDHSLAARARRSMSGDQLRIVLVDLPHLCPNCDSEMVLRQGNYDAFWGCPKYPKCRGKINCRKTSGARRPTNG